VTSYFQDGGNDVILHIKVLRPGEWTRSVCRRLYAAAFVSSWSVHSYFFEL